MATNDLPASVFEQYIGSQLIVRINGDSRVRVYGLTSQITVEDGILCMGYYGHDEMFGRKGIAHDTPGTLYFRLGEYRHTRKHNRLTLTGEGRVAIFYPRDSQAIIGRQYRRTRCLSDPEHYAYHRIPIHPYTDLVHLRNCEACLKRNGEIQTLELVRLRQEGRL